MTDDAGQRATAADDAVDDAGVQPPEAPLYDDPATADLTAKVTEAWAEFGRALAAALPDLPADTELELTLDPTASGRRRGRLRGERHAGAEPASYHAYAVSNAMLAAGAPAVPYGGGRTGGPRLVAARRGAGGGRAVRTAAAGRAGRPPGRDREPDPARVYGTPHPAFLLYSAVAPDGSPVEAPALGAARPLPADADADGPAHPSDLDAHAAAGEGHRGDRRDAEDDTGDAAGGQGR